MSPCATATVNGQTDQVILSSDVLIVGSGPIGAVYARSLINADQNIKVHMVEMGEQETPRIGDHKKNNVVAQRGLHRFSNTVKGALGLLSEPDILPTHLMGFQPSDVAAGVEPYNNLPAAPVVRGVGGMGSYWSCSTPEMCPGIERPDLFTDQEWQDLYKEAKALFGTTDTAFDDSVRHNIVKRALAQAHKDREFVNLPLACERSPFNPGYVQWTGSARILGELADPNYCGVNFALKARLCCRKLLIDETTRQVTGAELIDLYTNEVVMAKARIYVICAGAILTNGILFNSGIRPETGYNAVGHYLTEQTMAVCQVMLKNNLIESAWNDPRCMEHYERFPDDLLRIPFNDPSPQVTSPVSEKYPWHTQIQRDPFDYNKVSTLIDPRLIIDIRFFGYVEPVYDNYVTFEEGNHDPFGMPQPLIRYRVGEEGRSRQQAMMDDMINIARSLGDFLPGGEPRLLAPGAATHICGTTRAGAKDDGRSVVDKNSKVWRLENLFIGGCGVIPTQNACNPTLTAACFAIVGARKIVQELNHIKC
ncbi:pyranose 2-oxidase [Hypoxylon argillaceum]|nr:pyranose 2-oxidase [Hypoxylon argillaceum]